MKRYITALLSVVLIFSLSSCTKVIDLQLNTSPTQIVIQGNVYDQAGPYVVKISNSVKFSEPNVYPPVTGAKVTISDNTGYSEALSEVTPGTYVTVSLLGIPGRTYTLTVIADSKTYTAVSTMPSPINIDSIYYKASPFGNLKILTVKFLDPAGIDNYYRLIESINFKELSGFEVTDDKLFQGKAINYSFRPRGIDSLKLVTGDNINVRLESIDKGVYDYFRTASSDGQESASPANPTSNITNGALGYFNACALRQKVSRVP